MVDKTSGTAEKGLRRRFVSSILAVNRDHKSTLSEAERKIISDEQEKQRRKDKIEVWYEDKGYDCLVGGGKVGGLVLYTNFTGWCHANGEKPLTNTAFGNRIKSFYKGVIERSRSNGTHYELIKTSD